VNDGRVLDIGRFPIKSMLGESPQTAEVATTGLVGDRTHALFDCEAGKVASAKDPRKWAQLLGFRAVHSGEPGTRSALTITLPDGSQIRSDERSVDERLSTATGRDVELRREPVGDAGYDYVWEVEGIAPEAVVSGSQTDTTDEGKPVSTMPLALMAPGTFQDVAPITILTTAALAAMSALHPDGAWSPARFRSNLLVDIEGDEIVENGWTGRQVAVGNVVLEVTFPSPRCVMTTLPQLDLPRDRKILQTIARSNQQEFAGLGEWACLGVYATVITPGSVSVGDTVTLL
jgi:uncharacterized protein YcbX